MSSKIFHLTVVSRDLSQAEKKKILVVSNLSKFNVHSKMVQGEKNCHFE